MRKLAFILFFGVTLLWGQSITRVDFEVLPGSLIEVSYTIYDTEPNGVYAIDMYASLDGGYAFPIKAKSVSGDVGRRVAGAGRKSIMWKVLDDVPALVTDNLAIKVVGRTRTTFSGFFRSLVVGNRLTKRLSNGLTFYGGAGDDVLLGGAPLLGGMMQDELLEPRLNGRLGLRMTSVPFVYRLNLLLRNWDMKLPVEDRLRLKYLSFGASSYDGEELLLNYGGMSLSMAYTPLPIFGVFLPQVGGGVAFHQFRIGNSKGSNTSSLNNPSLFAEVGMQINLLRAIKFNVGVRQNFLGPWANFTEAFVEAGFHISTKR